MEFHALEEVMLMVLEEEWMKLHTLEEALEVVVEEAVKVPLQYPLQKDYDLEGMGKELSSFYLAQKMRVEVGAGVGVGVEGKEEKLQIVS